jgi:hypothetical protein
MIDRSDMRVQSIDPARLLSEKPDRLFPLDDMQVKALRDMPGLAIGEMAGRDSVAAILTALESDDVSAVLPVAVYMGAEYGDWQGFEENAAFVRRMAQERWQKPVFDLVWLGSPSLWRALNGRYITEIVQRFGSYSPCLACHFYLHASRIPLAKQLGASVVIGGDREVHNGRIKINQTPVAIDAYLRLFQRFGLELREPLRHLADVADLDQALGDAWPGGSPQPDCLFSGNYDRVDGSRHWSGADVSDHLGRFIYPMLEKVIAAHIDQQPIDYLQTAGEILSNR